jgi:hypothetical protein
VNVTEIAVWGGDITETLASMRPLPFLDGNWLSPYIERFDKLLARATARRNNVLDQIERYRAKLGQRLRLVSDNIIEAEKALSGKIGFRVSSRT